jgi:hypothetical protein
MTEDSVEPAVLCALTGASPNTIQTGRDHPVACARFAILDQARLPLMRCLPSSVNQRGHAVSLGGGDPGRVTLWPGHPNPVQPVGRNGKLQRAHTPDYRSPYRPRRCLSDPGRERHLSPVAPEYTIRTGSSVIGHIGF